MTFPHPKYFQFYPTIRCNQHCSFCFNGYGRKTRDMSLHRALDLLNILADSGAEELDIMGGEPLLLDWMPDFVRAAACKGITVNISTNGSSPELLRRLSESDPLKVTVGVSLEGGTAYAHNRLTHSSHFDHALKSIEELVSLGLDPVVKTVLNRTTKEYIRNIADLVRDMGVKRYYLIHMDVMTKCRSLMEEAFGFPDFLKLHEKMKRDNTGIEIFRVNASCFEKAGLPYDTRCAGGVLKLSVMPDGSAYPCNLFHFCGDFMLGNIFHDDFSSLWRSPKLTYFRTAGKNTCITEDCNNHAACTGGCPAHGYYHYGNTGVRDIRCAIAGGKSLRS